MTRKEEFETIVKICERAEKMNISAGERITLIMDLENAHKDVGIDLAKLLEADDLNFAHDVIGIQNHMNRSAGKLEDFFVPRYAQKYHDVNAIVENASQRSREQSGKEAAKVDVDKEL